MFRHKNGKVTLSIFLKEVKKEDNSNMIFFHNLVKVVSLRLLNLNIYTPNISLTDYFYVFVLFI